MIYLIVGRTGSGKDYLAQTIKRLNPDMKIVKSYATRPKRTDDEDTHIFITPEEAETYTDKVAVTNINGYEYFATAKQVDESDIYIIDPKGVEVLLANMPDAPFNIIYVHADDMERRINAVKRAEDKIREDEIFDQRDKAENEMFSEFEDIIASPEKTEEYLSKNVIEIYNYQNEYNPDEVEQIARYIGEQKKLHTILMEMLKRAIDLNGIPHNQDKLIMKAQDGSTRDVSIDYYACILLSNNDWFAQFMKQHLLYMYSDDTDPS